jgi:hypothetical protein
LVKPALFDPVYLHIQGLIIRLAEQKVLHGEKNHKNTKIKDVKFSGRPVRIGP